MINPTSFALSICNLPFRSRPANFHFKNIFGASAFKNAFQFGTMCSVKTFRPGGCEPGSSVPRAVVMTIALHRQALKNLFLHEKSDGHCHGH
jgi:hypothetical protein